MPKEDLFPRYTLIAGLETAVFGLDENAGAPVVICTHGRTGQLQQTFDRARSLVEAGFIAVAVEQRNHGRRIIDRNANLGFHRSVPVDTYGIFVGTARDVSTIIDFLPARLGIATDRIGMTGGSLGGHATLMAMGLDERIRVAVPLIGSGDYRTQMELRLEDHDLPAEGETFADYYPDGLARAVERFDPINRPEAFADRALLMVNGDADNVVRIEANRRVYDALKPHYAHPERLKLSEYPGIAHEVTDAMWSEAVAWFQRWLVDEPV